MRRHAGSLCIIPLGIAVPERQAEPLADGLKRRGRLPALDLRGTLVVVVTAATLASGGLFVGLVTHRVILVV
jgi:hypothetical protein